MPLHLANVPRAVARERPVGVISARGLANRGAVHPQRDPQVAGVGELGASRDTDLAAPVDGAPADREVVAVLDEDRVVAVIGEVDALDDSTPGLGDTEDATATATGDDLGDVHVGVVVPVGVAAVLVGKAEGCIACACSYVVAVDQVHLRVPGVLEQQAGLTDVSGDDLIDRQTVDVPGLNRVAACTSHADCVNLDVGVRSLVAVESDANWNVVSSSMSTLAGLKLLVEDRVIIGMQHPVQNSRIQIGRLPALAFVGKIDKTLGGSLDC